MKNKKEMIYFDLVEKLTVDDMEALQQILNSSNNIQILDNS